MLIQNAKILTPTQEVVTDVLIKDGVIEAIGRGLSSPKVIDAQENYLLPALIDLNVQSVNNALSHANFLQLERNALKGGVGSLALIPNPCICDEISLEFVKKGFERIEVYPLIGALQEENRLSEIAILLKKGAFSIFTSSDINPYLLARVFEYAKMYSIPLHIEPKNRIFRDVGVMNEGEVSFKLGLGGISKLEEWAEVAKVIEYSDYYGVEVIFKGVSTKKSLQLIANSKLCWAEVPIHHLLFSDEACEGYNTLAKISPPLREEEERSGVLEMLKRGKVDLLTSLHSPKSNVSKNVSFNEASFGIDSLGYYLPLLYTFLTKREGIPFWEVLKLTSSNPARFLNKKVGKVQEGYQAHLVLFNPSHTQKLTIDSLYKGIIINGAVQGVLKGDRWHSF